MPLEKRPSMRHVASLAIALALSACGNAPPAPEPIRWTPAAISTADYETTPTFSPDGREMVFFRADPGFATYRLFRSQCRNGAWSAAEPLPFAARPPAMDSDPGFTPDGKRLYFISTRHAPGSEDFDIYSVDRKGDGWGEPQRLPPPVNSPESELLPRADAAGNLYFGSARKGGQGQGDIYVATERNGTWSVRNVGPPVSTAAFEYEAEISRDGRTMVVVADRGDRSHLYRFDRKGSRWVAAGRLPGKGDVFQVGPLLSPRAEKLLFAQADGDKSGEVFLAKLAPKSSESWPPDCKR